MALSEGAIQVSINALKVGIAEHDARFRQALASFDVASADGQRIYYDHWEDGYEIESVEKVGDDLWRFNAKIGLRGGTAVIPVVVPMRWVGDTPMIMMTKTTVPGMSGSFTVRLFFHDDRYSGTWQHDGVGGGNMSGRVERR